MPQPDAHKSHLNGRDDRGRLKLPSTTYIPFQRIQNRPNRSIANSRRQSPEHGHKDARTSRSHSFNVSQLGNSKDEDKEGYYYDHDQDHKGGRNRRHRSKHREAEDNDTERRFHNLSLGNGNKARSRSLSHEHENTKMPYIPFQRVLHIRTRPIAREPDTGFKVPSFTDLKDRRDFRFRYDSKMRADGFTTEYRSRFKQKKKGLKGRRKVAKWKNDSHLNELLKENDTIANNGHRDTESEEENEDDEHNHGSDEETQNHDSLSPQGSRHSESSNSRNGLGNDSRSASSSSSVKFPQIQQSPLSTTESARSVKGKGALPPPRKSSPQSPEGISYSPNQLLLAKVQPVETARWVKGKGAGRLSQFFPLLKPSDKEGHKNPEPTIYTEKVNNQANGQNKTKNLSYTEKTYQLPSAKDFKKNSTKAQPKPFHSQNNTNAQIHNIKNQKKTLIRSKSDSSLYYQGNKMNLSNSNTHSLKLNEIIIFKEEVTSKTVNIGSRPKTTLPRIILTLPEEQTFPTQFKELDHSKSKVIKKGSQLRTRVPSLPQINTTKKSQMHENFHQRTTSNAESYSDYTNDWPSQQSLNANSLHNYTHHRVKVPEKYSNSRLMNNTTSYQNVSVPQKYSHSSSVNNKNSHQNVSVLKKTSNTSSLHYTYGHQIVKVPQKISYSSSMNNKYSHQNFKVHEKHASYNQTHLQQSKSQPVTFSPYKGFKAKLRHNASRKHKPSINSVFQQPSYEQIHPSFKSRSLLTRRDSIPLPITPRRYSQSYRNSLPPSQYDIYGGLSVQRDTAVRVLGTSGYSNYTKKHVEDIKQRRSNRLQSFLHLLGQKITNDSNYSQQQKERGFTARLKRSDLMTATF